MPKEADWVDIIRCDLDVSFSTGVENIDLKNLGLKNLSQDELEKKLRKSNIYQYALEEKERCEVIAQTGRSNKPILDGWAPSGDFIYIIRSCVAPNRLILADNMTKRECSKQVSISQQIKDYVNQRSEQEQMYLKKAQSYLNKMDQAAVEVKMSGERLIENMQECEDEEHERAVNQKFKQAVLRLAAVAVEVVLELKTGDLITNVKSRKAKWLLTMDAMDGPQLLQAFGGQFFSQVFFDLFAEPSDMPKTCVSAVEEEKI